MGTGARVPKGARGAWILVACGLWLRCASALFAAPTVWLEPSWTRVSPTAPAGTATELTVSAARGESESFQIIVRAPAGGLTQVNVTAPDLTGPGGAVIGSGQITLYREHYVPVTVSSPGAGGANKPLGLGWYPDALVPFLDPTTGQPVRAGTYAAAPFAVAAERNQPVWVDIAAPRTASPGQYQGTFTVTSDQGASAVTVTLQVWGFELPLRPALLSSFGNNLPGDSEVRELLRHRLMPRLVSPSQERTLIATQGLNCANAGFWSGADGYRCAMPPPPSVTQLQQAEAQHDPDLPLYAYTADEVLPCTDLYATLQQWARNLHQTRILNLVTMPPVPELYDDGTGTGRSAVDIWVLLPKLYDTYADRVQFVQDKGDQTWSYNCLAQDNYSPKWLLDYAPINFRLQPGFLNYSLGLTGLLYWSVDNWTSDPWTQVNSYEGGYPGEGILVYPGAPAGLPGQVVPSLRLKYLRDGVDDYDYLTLLQARGQGEQARSFARTVAPDWRNWSRDPAAVEEARRQAAALLETGFTDVSITNWAYACIIALRAAGYVIGYGDGTYRPAASVTRDQMAVFLARALAGGEVNVPPGPAVATFPDVSLDFWAFRHIAYLIAYGIVQGYPNGTYHPATVVTRDQMAAFIARSVCDPKGDAGLASFQAPSTATFSDVPPEQWAYTYVEYCKSLGIVGGYEDGSYRPLANVTRDQMAVYMVRAFKLPLLTTVSPRPSPRP